MDLILQPWPWYVSGALIAFVMWLLLYFGKSFGFSNNLRTLCTMCGADKFAPFFQFNWKTQSWNLFFLVGAGLGGYIATNFLTTPDYVVAISEATIDDLSSLRFCCSNSLRTSQPIRYGSAEQLAEYFDFSARWFYGRIRSALCRGMYFWTCDFRNL